MNDQQIKSGTQLNMNDFISAGMNLGKEDQLSASFREMDEMGNGFPLFPSVFPYFALSFERRKKYLPFGIKEICFFSVGY